MREFLHRLHARVGDFWWYAAVIFAASKVADLLNAFVGLWLVPKYVDPSELGAVTPLANFANFLALPIAVFANTFRNELTQLSVNKEYGKVKTLMRSAFLVATIFLVLAIIVSRLVLPMFLERIRIVEGSLGFLILISSFVGAICPIFNNALQSLKKFNESALIGVIGAPVRLIVMLIFMPFRAISGYFVGQTATPAFNIVASVYCLRRELSVPAEPYWSRAVIKRFAKLMAVFTTIAISGGIYVLVESTVLRQRLPDLDSAGYYMATRFSEISSFLTMSLVFTIFPFAADLAAKGRSAASLIYKSTLATFVFSVLVALPFLFFGREILALLPHGELYSNYWWAIPWLIGISCLSSFVSIYTTAEMSGNRFQYLKWIVPLDLAYPILLLLVTGYGYFTPYIPAWLNDFLTEHNIRSLSVMLWWMTAVAFMKAVLCLVSLQRQKVLTKSLAI